tara:strand:+ start:290 stop:661 length:372 start_codon:yes stop_codon:yes gene_type:complete
MRGRAVGHIDYAGPTGGAIAGAAMTAFGVATMFWFGVAATLWRLFFEPRVKELNARLEAQEVKHAAEMRDERQRCDEQLASMQSRVNQLETVLLMHGPQAMRQAIQAALSEQHVETWKRERGE